MKLVYIVIVAVPIAACSTHPLRCNGPLRPINKPAASDKPTASSKPSVSGKPAASSKPDHSTKPAGTPATATPATGRAEPQP